VVEQLGSTSFSSKLSKEEEKNPEAMNIPKKSVKGSKRVEEPRQAQATKKA
jgi:hypothetical protein